MLLNITFGLLNQYISGLDYELMFLKESKEKFYLLVFSLNLSIAWSDWIYFLYGLDGQLNLRTAAVGKQHYLNRNFFFADQETISGFLQENLYRLCRDDFLNIYLRFQWCYNKSNVEN